MDRLETAKRMIIAALMFSVFILLSILADSALRSGFIDRSPDMLIKGANLSGPAIFPSGHPMRSPESADAAIDLRFSPGLPSHLESPIHPPQSAAGRWCRVNPP
jgi:hypothetical protein